MIFKGDLKTCDDLYEQWLKEESDWGWRWIGWSDSYWLFRGKNKPNLIKAKHILEKGLAIKEVDNKNHMRDRLKGLEEKILTGLH